MHEQAKSTGSFETERLRVRGFNLQSKRDQVAIPTIYADPIVAKYLSSQFGPKSPEERLQDFETLGESLENGDRGLWAVERSSDRKLIGLIFLESVVDDFGDPTDVLNFSWHFAREFWGNGYAAEAATVVINHLFRVHRQSRVVSLIDPRNDRAKRLALRVGMEYQGPTQDYSGGKLLDFFSLARQDWILTLPRHQRRDAA